MKTPAADSQGRFAVISFDRHPETSTGVAQRVSDRIKTFNLDNVLTISVDDLTPELADHLARVDYAIFIDSPRMGSQVKVKVRPLEAFGSEPAGSSTPAVGHSCDPSSLLALTHSAYGHHPQAWLVQVYMPKAKTLPPDEVELALEQAMGKVESLIHRN